MPVSDDLLKVYQELSWWMASAVPANANGYYMGELHDLLGCDTFGEEPKFSVQYYAATNSFFAEVSGAKDKWCHGDISIVRAENELDIDSESLAILHWMLALLKHPGVYIGTSELLGVLKHIDAMLIPYRILRKPIYIEELFDEVEQMLSYKMNYKTQAEKWNAYKGERGIAAFRLYRETLR